MEFVNKDCVFQIPTDLAVCPYCNAELVATCNAWIEDDAGCWAAEDISVDCQTQPDFDSPDWEDWFNFHSEMPYVYWLPVHNKIEAWIKAHFRFIERSGDTEIIIDR